MAKKDATPAGEETKTDDKAVEEKTTAETKETEAPAAEAEKAVQEFLKSAQEQVDLFKLELAEAMEGAKKELIETYESLSKPEGLQAGTTLVAVDPVKALAERIFTQMCIHASGNFADRKYVKKAHEFAEAFLAYEPE